MSLFKRRSSNMYNEITSNIIYKNNHVLNIYDACSSCYNNTKNLSYLDKKEYLRKRIKAGHESILEHARLAISIDNITDSNLIAELTTYDYSRYLEFYSIHKEDNSYYLIINGNMRSYSYFLNHTQTDDYEHNILIRHIHKLLVQNTVKELYFINKNHTIMYDLYKDAEFPEVETLSYGYNKLSNNQEQEIYNKILEPSTGLQYDTIITKTIDIPTNNGDEKSIEIGVDMQAFQYLKDITYKLDMVPLNNDKTKTLYDDFIVLGSIIPITVVFKNISRTATHQLVRHRNAITQESQRYVNAKNASFTIPVPDYDLNKKFNIFLFNQKKEVSLYELADELLSVYSQLLSYGLKKEEARAFLPSNVNCGRLYMTFSYYNLIKFCNLRTDPHAQYEIRQYALAIQEVLDTINEEI